jgi:hypothetical protein
MSPSIAAPATSASGRRTPSACSSSPKQNGVSTKPSSSTAPMTLTACGVAPRALSSIVAQGALSVRTTETGSPSERSRGVPARGNIHGPRSSASAPKAA